AHAAFAPRAGLSGIGRRLSRASAAQISLGSNGGVLRLRMGIYLLGMQGRLVFAIHQGEIILQRGCIMGSDFNTIVEFAALVQNAPAPDGDALAAARARDGVLTKPPGALGRLEDIAAWYCSWRGDGRAQIKVPQVIIFAGNHGVTAQDVSAFPAEVTAQMVRNFRAGGAAVNQ